MEEKGYRKVTYDFGVSRSAVFLIVSPFKTIKKRADIGREEIYRKVTYDFGVSRSAVFLIVSPMMKILKDERYWKRRDIERLLMTLESPDQQSF